MKAYVEYGLDFDNNRFGFGKSTEIENDDGTEYRIKTNISIYNKCYYVRLWIGKKVFSYSVHDGFKIKTKKRNNFKLILGVAGYVPSINLICGFMGFGKTTYAKKLEAEISAIRFTHDEIMFHRYGRTPKDFTSKYKKVDADIKQQAIQTIKAGKNVILDYGFWSKKDRKEYYDWAKSVTPNVFFHVLDCDISVAKERILLRTKNNMEELFIDENCFNDRLKLFEPYQSQEGYPKVVYCKT